jgi:hypothetical protein
MRMDAPATARLTRNWAPASDLTSAFSTMALNPVRLQQSI